MNFSEYQEKAAEFAAYENETYPFLALAEEVGEFLGIIAKAHRGDDLIERFGTREALCEATKKEAGDILWQLAACLRELEMDMQEVAEMNLQKLADRKARNVIKGSGDNR